MRSYGRVAPTIWTGTFGRSIRGDHLAQALAHYLITGPHANMIGLYYLPIAYMASDLGSPFEGASKALRKVCELGYAKYDEEQERVWVVEAARHEFGPKGVSDKDNRHKPIVEMLNESHNSFLCSEFLFRYGEFLSVSERDLTEPLRSPLASPLPRPSVSQEQEQEQEQEQHQELTTALSLPVPGTDRAAPERTATEKTSVRTAVDQVWTHYLACHSAHHAAKNGHAPPAPKLTAQRRDLIKRRLRDGYGADEQQRAISAMFATPHNLGQNDRGREYLSLEIALRINAQGNNLERFRDSDAAQAAPPPETPEERRRRQNREDFGHL